MSFSSLIQGFMSGLKSAVSWTGLLKQTIASSIAEGVEAGIQRIMPVLLQSLILGAIFITGIFLVGWGTSLWAESWLVEPGAGFFLVGIVFLVGAALYVYVRK